MDHEEALFRLRAGNERFVAGESVHPHETREWRQHLAHGTHPFATILCCSDAASAPELIFDQGLGDLFVIRVAGNVIAPALLGSIQFAGAYLGTRLFLVLGHTHCPTVRAALEERAGRSRQAGQIEALMRLIQPALQPIPVGEDPGAQLPAAIEANVRHSMRQLVEMPEARKAMQRGHVRVVGAVSDVATGQVRFLD